MPLVLQPLVKNKDVDMQAVNALVHAAGISVPAAKVLFARGFRTPEEVHTFLHGGKEVQHSPLLLQNLQEGVTRIRAAIEKGVRIVIYGDYDADGVCSTAILVNALKSLGANVDYYLPDRHREGYGLNADAIRQLASEGAGLIITVDCGINALAEVALANSLSLPIIVTDHHELPPELPECLCINPKMEGYPFPSLAGAGVALKLAIALIGEESAAPLYEFAALATVADIVPLTDENRYIVKQGLHIMNTAPSGGVQAIIKAAAIQRAVTAADISFVLAPRINAAGRLEDACMAVELLLGNDREANAAKLSQLNKTRQELQEEIIQQATEMAYATGQVRENRVLCLASPNWDKGVIGIAASKLVERFCRPCFLFSLADGMATGSGRSIAGVHLYNVLHESRELLTRYGGHEMAAGLSLKEENLRTLHEEMDYLVASATPERAFYPAAKYDARVTVHDLTLQACRDLELFAPFGMGNPTPRFRIDNARLSTPRMIGKQKDHLKLSLRDAMASMEGLVYRYEEQYIDFSNTEGAYTVVASPQLSTWNSVQSTVLRIQNAAWNKDKEDFPPFLKKEEQALCQAFCRQYYGQEEFPFETEILEEAEEFTAALQEYLTRPAGTLVLCAHPQIAKTLGGLALSAYPACDISVSAPADRYNGFNTLLLAPDANKINWRAYSAVLIADGVTDYWPRLVQEHAPHAECVFYKCDSHEMLSALPAAYGDFSRAALGAYYMGVKKLFSEDRRVFKNYEEFCFYLTRADGRLNGVQARLALSVFAELNLLSFYEKEDYFTLDLPEEAKTVELTASTLYNRLNPQKVERKGRLPI